MKTNKTKQTEREREAAESDIIKKACFSTKFFKLERIACRSSIFENQVEIVYL